MPLNIGEDLTAAASAGTKRSIKLSIHVTGLTAKHGLTIKVNGKTLQGEKISDALDDQPKDVWLKFVPDVKLFKLGENLVEATLTQPGGTVKIDQIKLDVRYPKESMRDSANWEGKYEANVLPTDPSEGWIKKNSPVGTVSRGILTLGHKSGNEGDGYKKENLPGSKRGMSIEYRIRVTAGPGTGKAFRSHSPNAPSIGRGLGETYFELGDFGTKPYVAAWKHSKPYAAYNIDISKFHTYRYTYTADSPIVSLYVDDNPTAVATAASGGCGFKPPSYIEFWPYDSSVIELDYLRWTTTGAYAPPSASE